MIHFVTFIFSTVVYTVATVVHIQVIDIRRVNSIESVPDNRCESETLEKTR